VKILKIAWSHKRKNHLVNFYALEPDKKGKVEVLTPPFSWFANEDAIAQINIERDKKGQPAYHGKILHVVLDMSSGRLYLPNMEEKDVIASDPALTGMLDAIKIKIEQLVDFIPMAPLIRGDPLNTIRIRRVGDFRSVAGFIRRQVRDMQQFEKDISIPVVEADLTLMPKTLQDIFGDNPDAISRQWAFVGDNKTIEFSVREGSGETQKDLVTHYQKAPFILINTAKQAKVSDADKERCVILAYKEYAVTNRPDNPDSKESPQLQSFKYLMYIGWSFRELSLYILQSNDVTTFRSLMFRSSFLYNAAKSLKKDGYPDPSSKPYYYCFQIGKGFPVNIRPEAGVEVFDYSEQPDIFQVVFFDQKTSYITFKTPMFIPEETLKNIFKPESDVFVAQYDSYDKSVKTSVPVDDIKKESGNSLNAVITDCANINGKNKKEIGIKERTLFDSIFERKHISDYPQATEIIKDLCERLVANPDKEAKAVPEKIRFDDLEVVVGPWKSTVGFLGGYADVRKMDKTFGKPTIEPIPGFFVEPPVIMIDNEANPSVGDRTNVIIHEYRHHINTQLWVDSPVYDVLDKQQGETVTQRNEKMIRYLKSPDERTAHKTQFKYMLAIGMSKEQILRQLMGGKPTIQDIPVVKEYLGIINEAATEIDTEQKEEEVMDQMQAEINRREENMNNGQEDISDFFDPDEDPL
jgi:hypothetical protein